MSAHFQAEVERLRKRVLGEAALVEDAITKAIDAYLRRDEVLAEEVVRGDAEIDEQEIAVEEECLRILALHQPVARDLRFIVTVLKMNNDLERMGDLSVSIARRARYLARKGDVPNLDLHIDDMSQRVREMVKWSLDALINGDSKLARQVCLADDAVDELKRQNMRLIRARIQESPEIAPVLLKMLDVPRHLERLADLATNIAEDVIYLVEGEIIRHQHLADQPDHDVA